MYSPDIKQFRNYAKKGNLVPVYRQMLADTITPVLAYQKLASSSHGFLFESVTGGENIGRYSFLGVDPLGTFVCKGNNATLRMHGKVTKTKTTDPLGELGKLLSAYRPVKIANQPGDFSGGAVGYAAYDTVRYVESLPDPPPDTLRVPDLCFMLCDTVIVFDHVLKTMTIISNAHTGKQSAKKAYDEAVRKIERLVRRLRAPMAAPINDITPMGDMTKEFTSNFTREQYHDIVLRAKEYIYAGDIFQVVPSQRLHTTTTADSFDIYRALRAVNPSPYMFYLRMGNLKLIGSSPEVMVRVDEGIVTLRPIAGTRPRGKTEEEDKALAEELLADPKERAEHIMLLDLGRNDVGRVCDFNTVKITEEMIIERYSHVMHIVSNVQGKLSRGKTSIDALKASLPAGTLSGAPKVRAMEIIDELEPERRGPYGGAVGYIDFSRKTLNTGITIRTVVLKGQDVYLQAGGGVVADSVPETEYQETLNKARALLRAIQVAEQCFSSSRPKRKRE